MVLPYELIGDCKLKYYFCDKLFVMKKILGILIFVVVLSGCNDGDITVSTINFDNITANSCGEIIYKIKDTEALFMNIPESENAFSNDITLENKPKLIAIGGEVTLKYRFYDGKVSPENICIVAGPIKPQAIEEWVAKAGFIEINTTARYSTPDPVTGQTKILKYNHTIVFKNLVFAKPDGTDIKYDEFIFGDYLTDANALTLDFDPTLVASCTDNSKIYNVLSTRNQSLVIENPNADLIQNTGVVSQQITSTSNKLVLRLYTTPLPTTLSSYFCGTTTPTTPLIKEEWIATGGTIEITNTTSGGFLHTIYLKKVTFQRGESTFYYGDSVLYGELLLPN